MRGGFSVSSCRRVFPSSAGRARKHIRARAMPRQESETCRGFRQPLRGRLRIRKTQFDPDQADLSPLSTLSTGRFLRLPPFANRAGGSSRHFAVKEDRPATAGLPRRRQCREGRYPSGRRPGTLWWGSRKEARGSGETLSRTHFSGVRQDLNLRGMELRKAAPRACSTGDRTGLEGFARKGTDGRETGFAR